jgi:hypothetical protein
VQQLGADRMIKPTEFLRIQTLSKPFTLDGFSNPSGSNALCKDFCSPDRSFFSAVLTGHHTWVNPPFHLLQKILEKYLHEKSKSPFNTSACFLVPKWSSSWKPLLLGMKKLIEYPEGFPLFELPAPLLHDRQPLKGIPWPVEVYYDPPQQPARISAALSSDSCKMIFHGTANKVPVTIAADTQASLSFIDRAFTLEHSFRCTPSRCRVELADGSHTESLGECMVLIRLPGTCPGETYTHQQRCLVIDLGAEFDVILGDDWLTRSQADLSYRTGTCTVQTPRGPVILTPLPSHKRRPRNLPLLSAISAKRHMNDRRSSARIFLVNVIDDGVSPMARSGGGDDVEADPPHPLDPHEDIVFPQHVTPATRKVLETYRSVFNKMSGKLVDRGIDHVIPTVPGAKPAYRPAYRLSPAETQEVEKQVAELLLQGLIEPSSSPFGAPVLFVSKPDGSLRMCIDYRLLNSQTIKNKYPLPRIDQLIDQLNGAKVMSSLDLQSGYWQIKLAPEDVHKSAFITPYGQYQFKCMSFGLCNAPSTFQAIMNKIFRPYLGVFVLVYLDDILIYSKSPDLHADHLAKVLQVLQENEFYVRLCKCDFEKKELKFLGHIVGGDGIKVDPGKIEVVRSWPTPTSVTQVRSFLGLANYFRKFLKDYSTLVAPLTALTKQSVVWGPSTWTPQCQEVFDSVKKALTEAPTLAIIDFANHADMQLEVLCDASMVGIGAVLTQFGRPLAFESKKLTDAEKNWTTGDQELWAVIHALKVWRCYLEGVKFTVVTDHHPLVHLQSQPSLSRRQARWSEYLQRFDFDWQYRPGSGNVADPLSRLPMLAVTRASRSHALPPPPTVESLGKRQRRPTARFQTPPQDPLVLPDPPTAPAPTKPKRSKLQTMHPPPAVSARDTPPDQANDADHLEGIQRGYASDAWFSDPKNTERLSLRDGLWWRGSQIVVPDLAWVKRGILFELHDTPFSGHCGIRKTYDAVSRLFWWPKLRLFVQSYISACEACQRNKSSTQKPAGLLQPLPIPSEPWESVSCDFITGLPKTARGFDAIIVFVDRLTKMTHIAPTTTTVDAAGTARLFVEHVWKHHGITQDLVSDRGSVFVGKFFSELLSILGTKHKRSTAFHPQTDGQTERVNRVLEDMLRHYVMGLGEQVNWDLYLSSAEFAINNSFHESIGTTPFRLNYGRDPRLPLMTAFPGRSQVPSAAAFADKMAHGLAQAKKALAAAQQRQKRHADQHRRDTSFEVGAQVLLSSVNIHLRHPRDAATTAKLLPKWIGPFTITQRVGTVAYKLQLPDGWQVHPVFHVSLLKPYRTDGRLQPPPPQLIDGEAYFLVERIVDHRSTKHGRRTVHEYLIRWLGYGPEHNSWEPHASIAESENGDTLRTYWNSLGYDPPPS